MAKYAKYKDKVNKVFKTLKDSIEHHVLSDYRELEGEVTSCNVKDKASMIELVCKLQRIERHIDHSALKVSYHLGLLFAKLKKQY